MPFGFENCIIMYPHLSFSLSLLLGLFSFLNIFFSVFFFFCGCSLCFFSFFFIFLSAISLLSSSFSCFCFIFLFLFRPTSFPFFLLLCFVLFSATTLCLSSLSSCLCFGVSENRRRLYRCSVIIRPSVVWPRRRCCLTVTVWPQGGRSYFIRSPPFLWSFCVSVRPSGHSGCSGHSNRSPVAPVVNRLFWRSSAYSSRSDRCLVGVPVALWPPFSVCSSTMVFVQLLV